MVRITGMKMIQQMDTFIPALAMDLMFACNNSLVCSSRTIALFFSTSERRSWL